MAFFENTRSNGLTSKGRPSTLTTLVARFREWNDERITRKALGKLSDHELHDIGLSRGDIDSVAGGRLSF